MSLRLCAVKENSICKDTSITALSLYITAENIKYIFDVFFYCFLSLKTFKLSLLSKDFFMAIYLEPFSPVAVSILGFDVRWYALAYITAFIVGYFLFKYLMRRGNIVNYSKKQMDDFLSAIILGVIIGGRLGYVLFYNLSFFIAHPLEIFMVWHGGMSFHGGLIGVIVANFLFARKNKTNCLAALDLLAIVSPVGLFFGRIANFINMEIRMLKNI